MALNPSNHKFFFTQSLSGNPELSRLVKCKLCGASYTRMTTFTHAWRYHRVTCQNYLSTREVAIDFAQLLPKGPLEK